MLRIPTGFKSLDVAKQPSTPSPSLLQTTFRLAEEKNEDGKIIPAGYRECIFHWDLKPDHMLLTKNWQLKLARASKRQKNHGRATSTRCPFPLFTHV